MIESASAPVLKESASSTAAYVCRIGLAFLVTGALLAAGLAVVYPLFESKPFWGIWEDSFMLVRYADNLRAVDRHRLMEQFVSQCGAKPGPLFWP